MRFKSTVIALVVVFFCVTIGINAQEKQTPLPAPSPTPRPLATEPAATPAANPADVASVDSIIAAVYDVISGPAGKKRDWDRMRSLFLPGARLIPTGPRQGGGYGSRVLTVDDYIARSSGFFEKEGFYEKEVARVTEQFGEKVAPTRKLADVSQSLLI